MNECGCHRGLKLGSFTYLPSVHNSRRRKKNTLNILIYFPPEVKQYEISEHQRGDGGPITAELKDYQFMKNAFLYPPESPRTGTCEHTETRFRSQEDTKEHDRVTNDIRQSDCSFESVDLPTRTIVSKVCEGCQQQTGKPTKKINRLFGSPSSEWALSQRANQVPELPQTVRLMGPGVGWAPTGIIPVLPLS